MSEMVDSNVFLILMRLDLSENNPLSALTPEASLPRMDEGKKYTLLAGLLDPSLQTTRTPLTPIYFRDEERQRRWQRLYNNVVARFEALINKFYDPDDGYVLRPERLTRQHQEQINEEIERIGGLIYSLIPTNTPLCRWFDQLFEGDDSGSVLRRRPEDKHVTIITNDFSIPWYWMKANAFTPLLCEICSLGTLQLASRNVVGIGSDEAHVPVRAEESPRALFLNGTSGHDLPFVEEEIASLGTFIRNGRNQARRRLKPFEADVPADMDAFRNLWWNRPSWAHRSLYRIIHYSGHWNSGDKELTACGEPLDVERLKELADSAFLALDGCSTSRGLQAWSEIENLTGKLLGFGALGCVVTTLPVKNDPIASKVFWEALYSALLADGRNATVGQALIRGRQALKKHFESICSPNPAWAFYQLIGNPSVKLLEDSSSRE
jgi:hypothetical protein